MLAAQPNPPPRLPAGSEIADRLIVLPWSVKTAAEPCDGPLDPAAVKPVCGGSPVSARRLSSVDLSRNDGDGRGEFRKLCRIELDRYRRPLDRERKPDDRLRQRIAYVDFEALGAVQDSSGATKLGNGREQAHRGGRRGSVRQQEAMRPAVVIRIKRYLAFVCLRLRRAFRQFRQHPSIIAAAPRGGES